MLKYRLEDEGHVVLGCFEYAHGLAEPQRTFFQHKEISLFGFENGYLTPEGQQWILEARKTSCSYVLLVRSLNPEPWGSPKSLIIQNMIAIPQGAGDF